MTDIFDRKTAQNNAVAITGTKIIINSFKFFSSCQCLRKNSLFREKEVGGDFCGYFERNYWVFSRALKVETTSSL